MEYLIILFKDSCHRKSYMFWGAGSVWHYDSRVCWINLCKYFRFSEMWMWISFTKSCFILIRLQFTYKVGKYLGAYNVNFRDRYILWVSIIFSMEMFRFQFMSEDILCSFEQYFVWFCLLCKFFVNIQKR